MNDNDDEVPRNSDNVEKATKKTSKSSIKKEPVSKKPTKKSTSKKMPVKKSIKAEDNKPRDTKKPTTQKVRTKPSKKTKLSLETETIDFVSDDIGLHGRISDSELHSISEEEYIEFDDENIEDPLFSDDMNESLLAHESFLAQEPELVRSKENYLNKPSEQIDPNASSLKKVQVRFKSSLEKIINILIRPFAPPIPIKKLLLTNEIVVDNVLLVYFTEGQLLLGLLMAVIGVYIVGLLPFKLLGGIILLIGILFFFTASGSEEIYITTSRLLVRRLNLIDRVFHIPRDEQYLIKQAVSFQIGRAPINRILVLLDVILVIWTFYSPPATVLSILIWISATISFYYALRIRKRAISFQMSGGGNIAIGVNKGIPLRFVQNFTETLLSRTLEN